MRKSNAVLLAVLLVLAGCGDGDGRDAPPGVAAPPGDAGAATSDATGDAHDAERADDESSGPEEGPVLTAVPDPCDYFTRDDAEAVLGEATGSGKSYDAGGWNCVYDTQGAERKRIVFDMYVGRGDAVEDTQIGMSIEACAAEAVARFDDLGRDSALYRQTAAHCNGGYFLWVLTDARFEGRLRPEFERNTEGPVHFLVSVSPTTDRNRVADVLRDAASRALGRLR